MDNIYLPFEAKIVNIFTETEDKNIRTFDLELIKKEDKEKFNFLPGQFAQFSLYAYGESPFGIASSPLENGILKFSINKTGVVTKKIHELQIGDKVGIRGPFGNYFPLEKLKGSNIIIIGGGFAFTTLRALIQYLLDPKNRKDYKKIFVLYGARTPGMLLYKELLNEWQKREDIELYLTVDRASEEWKGREGLIPNVLKDIKPSSENSNVILCGPPIMIKFTLAPLDELKFKKDKIFTSLEMRMKCAVGKCGRCNIGPKYVCKNGPIFSIEELGNFINEL
jgi:sulfhydrogenase subunit gamma (sulfur reductase)